MWRTKLLWSTSTPLRVTWSIGRRLASTGSGGVRRRPITRPSSSGSDRITIQVTRWEVPSPLSLTMHQMVYGSLRVKLPTDPKYLSRIQTDYNGMDRLINDLVRPTVTKVIYASGPLMSAFESYAEKKNDLIEYITDQLNNGVYKTAVKRVEIMDAITGDKKIVNIATLIPDSLSLQEVISVANLRRLPTMDWRSVR